jgi:uncharacterized protein (TIGR03437 family)
LPLSFPEATGPIFAKFSYQFSMKLPLFALVLAAVPVWADLQMVSGNGQMLFENTFTVSPMVVRAVDQNGRPMADVPVQFTIPPGRRGAIVPAGPVRTSADGTASATFTAGSLDPNQSFGENQIIASSPVGSVTFVMTTVQGRYPAPLPRAHLEAATIRGTAGSVVREAVKLTVVAVVGPRAGQGVPNIAMRLAVPDSIIEPESAPAGRCNTPTGMVLTNAQGVAVCDVLLNGNAGSGMLQAIVGEQVTVGAIPIEISPAQQCNLTFTSSSTQSYQSSGGSGSISFNAGSGCTWSAQSNATWIQLTSANSGTGGGIVSFTVGANTGGARTGTITVANQTLTINQAAPSSGGGGNGGGGNGGGGTLAITTTSVPAGTVGVPYSAPINITGGCPANPFGGGARAELDAGSSLPDGLQLNGFSIEGTPTAPGTFPVTIRVTACQESVTRQFVIAVSTAQAALPMTAAPVSVVLNGRRGSVAVLEARVNVAAGGTSVPFTAAAISAPVQWLRVDTNNDRTPATLTIQALGYGDLPPGSYSGEVNLISQAPNSPLKIPVTLNITAPAAATATPERLRFEYSLGGNAPDPQQLAIGSSGGALNFLAVPGTMSGGSWLDVGPRGGVAPANLLVTTRVTGLGVGTYEGNIIVTPDTSTGPITVPVTLTVRGAGPRITSVRNGASFREGPVAPGEIVTIFGNTLGPQTLANLRLTAQGKLDTTLETVRVYFDNQPVPLIHAVASQITLVAPYWLHGRRSVPVQVEYNGVRSQTIEVPVADTAPGIFTVAGTTQAAVINENGGYNTLNNGALPGTIISLYATGEGPTIPVGVEGSITPNQDPPKPWLDVTVTIGGREAQVLYAGSAPGAIAGLFQVNVRVPEGLTPGASPVVLTVGQASSQPEVTVWVAAPQQ